MSRPVAVLTALIAALLVLAPSARADLTIYSSLPLQGPARVQAADIVRGMQLALQHANGQAAGQPVRYVSLDNSSPVAGNWTPDLTAENARRAAQDETTVAYLGEFNSGASAISMPMLNEAGILQISPSNTAVGLTVDGRGADAGEPDKYYPTGTRHYGRIVPHDVVQANAAGKAMKEDGVKRVLVIHDGEIYGEGLARQAAVAARRQGIRLVSVRRLGRRGGNARALARLARRADAVFYGGITVNGAPRLWRSLYRAKRTLKLYGGDGVAESRFAESIGPAARRTKVLVGTLSPQSYPAAGQQVLAQLGPDTDPYALYGYEAMALALDSINRGGATRKGTLEAFFFTKDRDSVLGRYSIDESGDTTDTRYGLYRIADRQLVFERVVVAAP